jgi:hypothetical protein
LLNLNEGAVPAAAPASTLLERLALAADADVLSASARRAVEAAVFETSHGRRGGLELGE